MERVIEALGSIGAWGYVIVGVMAFLEASAFVGLVAPGETAVVVAGFLAGQSYLSPFAVAAAAGVGAVLGDSVGYELGYRFGRPLLERHGRRLRFRRQLERSEELFARHGGKTVFFGRFVGFLRTFAPFVAGISHMPYRTFLVYNASGGIVWATAFTTLGYFAGANWRTVERWLGRIGIVIFLLVIGLAILWWRHVVREPA